MFRHHSSANLHLFQCPYHPHCVAGTSSKLSTCIPVRCLIAIKPTDYIEPNESVTWKRNTRNYKQLQTNTTIFANSFFPRTTKEWNMPKDTMVHAPSLESFHHSVHQHLPWHPHAVACTPCAWCSDGRCCTVLYRSRSRGLHDQIMSALFGNPHQVSRINWNACCGGCCFIIWSSMNSLGLYRSKRPWIDMNNSDSGTWKDFVNDGLMVASPFDRIICGKQGSQKITEQLYIFLIVMKWNWKCSVVIQ